MTTKVKRPILSWLLVLTVMVGLMPVKSAASTTDGWNNAYKDFILNLKFYNSGQHYEREYGDDITFGLYDMNGDKIPEIINYSSGYSAMQTLYVYTYINGKVVYIGNFGQFYPKYVTDYNYPGLIADSGRMGYWETCYASYENGSFNVQPIVNQKVQYDESTYHIIEVNGNNIYLVSSMTSNSELYKTFIKTEPGTRRYVDAWGSNWQVPEYQSNVKELPMLQISQIRSMGWDAYVKTFPQSGVWLTGKGFYDVLPDTYYNSAVSWAIDQGITNGMDATHFGPDRTVTRGQAVTFLWRACGCPNPKSTRCPFRDVSSGDYFYKPVLWAVEQGITNGTSSDTFSPNDNLTRAHMVTFLYRACGQPGKKGDGEWYSDAERWGKNNGIVSGTGTAYRTNDSCPRCDVVYYLWKNR